MESSTINQSGFSINKVLWENLRKCQQESIENALRYLRTINNPETRKSCLISLPTGAGKSGVIAIVAHKATQKKILILTHRRAVCDQLFHEVNGNFFKERASNQNIKLKKVFNKIDKINRNGIYVSTFQKLQSFKEEELKLLKKNIDLIIIDEGHAEPSPVWRNLVRGTKAYKIVITATPYRNDLFQFDISHDHSYIYTFEKALEDKVLNDPIFDTIKREELFQYIKKYLSENVGSKCIIKCRQFDVIEEYYNLLNEEFSVLAVHEKYIGDKRENVKVSVPAKLKESEYQIIIHQRKLDEGVDIPQAKLLILTYVISSGRELVQTVGRVVRIFNNLKPKIIEFDNDSNLQIWKNYRYFDKTLNDSSSLKKFIASLDINKLIENYLESFPEASYYENNFLRKFDLNSFDPNESLIIPTASICFLNKKNDFKIELASDILYWRCNNSGELAKQFDVIGDIKIIISIAFNKSRFIKNRFFFEPSLELTLLKVLEPNIVAIYDSRGRKFKNDKDLKIGSAVSQDKLFNVLNIGDRSISKESSSRSISTANRRPESIHMKGKDLDQLANLQNNSAYRISTLKCDNFDKIGDKLGSYYVGVDSGRISDQKEKHFSLSELNDWLIEIEKTLLQENQVTSSLIHSFAKPLIEIDLNLKINSVIFDFSDSENYIEIPIDDGLCEIENSFKYYEYNEGFLLDQNNPNSLIKISILNESPFFELTSDNESIENVLSFMTENLHKVLLEKGICFSQDKFFQLKLPTEEIVNSGFFNTIIGMEELKGDSIDEKGYVKGTIEVFDDSFNDKSVFYLVDQLRLIDSTKPSLSDLGPFHKYFPDVDLILCTDMGTEPCDFILSSIYRLVYVHIKCGGSTNPRSSAGALSEVGNQAIKNIEMLISNDTNLKAGNWNLLHKKWPTDGADSCLNERIRLFNGKRFYSNGDESKLEKTMDELWRVVSERRRSSFVKKEIWIIAANSFSASDFRNQITSENGRAESRQAFQLIQTWITTAYSNDVDIKFFVSP